MQTMSTPALASAKPPIMPLEVLERTVGLNRYIPQVPWPKQMDFLELECLDALYGGAASGGKVRGC